MNLITAAENGYIDMTRSLLESGANPNIVDDYGETALMVASIEDETEIIKLLLDRGASINIQDIDGNTAVMNASIYGNIDVVRILLDRGASINIINNDGYTVLDLASRRGGHQDIVRLFKQHEASRNVQRKFRGRRTRRKIRTQKAKQRFALSRFPYADDLAEHISKPLNRMPYNPEVSIRMANEQDRLYNPYTEWLQDRLQI